MNKFSSVFISITFLLLMNTQTAISQSTFTRVYEILQSNCSASGCHGSSNPQVFDVSGSEQSVYNEIVGVTGFNSSAVAKGYKLVDAGNPYRSFLLRKIAHGLSSDLLLDTLSEGVNEPRNAPKLEDAEIELVRQWILYGAPQTGQVVDEQRLIDFYNGQGLSQIAVPAAPAPSEGFQIHEGPIFLAPGEEKEFLWKYQLDLGNDVEVNRLQGVVSSQSHHFILYHYNPGAGSGQPAGLQIVDNLIDQFNINTNAAQVAVWQFDRDHELPQGTAYFWKSDDVLSLNFHIKNYSQDSILAGNAYINVYTQPQGSGAVEMFSDLISYGGFNPFGLQINNNGVDTTFTIHDTYLGETWHIWILQAHTHSRGKDFDIFLRNPDGTKGNQIYEGFYNEDYTFNQGFFDYSHPAVREFSPLLDVDMNNGFIHEAKFNNSGPSPVSFGLTTNDEMFITYMQYTADVHTTVSEVNNSSIPLNIYPNPTTGQFEVSYNLPKPENVRMELFNLIGERIKVLQDETKTEGIHRETFNCSKIGLDSGIYFLKFSSEEFTKTEKVMVN